MSQQQATGSKTIVLTTEPTTIEIKLKQMEKAVQWEEGTVDNEHLNKKKSSSNFSIDITGS